MHCSLVAKVSFALDSSEMEEDSGKDNDLSEEKDEEMPDEDDGPDDSMSLVQYQAEVRQDALIRLGSHAYEISPKKGSVETGGSCS